VGGYYPPGVTGREFAIAGPDAEREVSGDEGIACPGCGGGDDLSELRYGDDGWYVCEADGCNGREFGSHSISEGLALGRDDVDLADEYDGLELP
jgi:hypothetical protein